jgi:hypothetical protein
MDAIAPSSFLWHSFLRGDAEKEEFSPLINATWQSRNQKKHLQRRHRETQNRRPTVKVKTSTQRNFGGRGELRKENSSRHGTNLIVSNADGPQLSDNVPSKEGDFSNEL